MKRAVGLAKDEKHNSKLKPVTLSTPYSLKAFRHSLPEHSLLIETAGPDTEEIGEKNIVIFSYVFKGLWSYDQGV